MAGFRTYLWLAGALAGLSAPAAAQPAQVPAPDPCRLFHRLIAAAREAPAFASVQRALERGEAVVPGFGAAGCRVDAGSGFVCREWNREERRFPAWENPLVCAGLTRFSRPEGPAPGRRSYVYWRRTFGAPDGIEVEYGLGCGGCRGAPLPYFKVTLPGQWRSGE